MKRMPARKRLAFLVLACCALAVGISFIWEGPRTVYAHAVIICLDCIGLI
ncbi:MAG: hypothetical protein H5T74_13530 [Actinobacteria bacterium]|nr:hypothetical protein [Actinomycetota bacterium]MDI6831721.1 hypothetical protein [Actinomycetota bacterium]